jgi:aspartyl/glutamyl-tRNA(Asn/Gln) amidotransferase C subunit
MDIKTIDYLAELARLDMPSSEKESIANDIGGVLVYVDQITEVAKGLGDIGPEYLKSNVSVNDEPLHTGGQYSETILNEAPNREVDYIVVKKVL